MQPSTFSTTDRLRRLLLSVPNRRRIYEAVVRTPGIHVRRLERDLDLAIGSIQHHLRHLERHGLIFCHKNGRRRTYYCADTVDPGDASLLHVLQRPPCADILAALLLGSEGSVSHVAARIGLPTPQTSHHLRRMRDEGLLENVRVGRASVYLVVEPDRILRLLGRHFPASIESDTGLLDLVRRTETVSRRIHASGYPVSILDAPTSDPLAPTIDR